MNSNLEKIYDHSPNLIQEIMVSFYNYKAYNRRYGNKYKEHLNALKANNKSLADLKEEQFQKFMEFINHAKTNSKFYSEIYKDIDFNTFKSIEDIVKLPIIDKEVLRDNINDVYTLSKESGHLSKTGGTTGKSLEVLYTNDDIQERFAFLDNFRSNFGYKLGKKTAWFSGKNLLTKNDLKRNRFWKTDHFYKVRYYSTFHIHNKYLKFYLTNLIKYKPEYMVGFPSTIYEIAKFGIANNIGFPENTIKAIFPTAETITTDIREVIEGYFKTKLYNQYASSEGAPFIIECSNNKLHLELQTGVFEVLDSENNYSNKGRLVVTSFNTHGTPLIRYDIGDSIELSSGQCNCNNNNPLVKEILGRVSDYIYSEETGKINLGNISNCLKGVKGIVKFQIQQDEIDKLLVLIITDNKVYSTEYETLFLKNLKDRLGNKINIELKYVADIPVEKSGKFRIVKNNLKM